MKQFILISILIVCLISTVIVLLHQNNPGKYNWFHSMSGDWTIELHNGYEIGPSTTSKDKNRFDVIKWIPINTPEQKIKYAPQIVVDKIISYSIFNDLIILKSTEGWLLLYTLTGEHSTFNDPDFPEQFEEHRKNMKVPKPSMRNELWFLSFL